MKKISCINFGIHLHMLHRVRLNQLIIYKSNLLSGPFKIFVFLPYPSCEPKNIFSSSKDTDQCRWISEAGSRSSYAKEWSRSFSPLQTGKGSALCLRVGKFSFFLFIFMFSKIGISYPRFARCVSQHIFIQDIIQISNFWRSLRTIWDKM